MKFSGVIGFVNGHEETSPSVYAPNIVEKQYRGDVLKSERRFTEVSDKQNPDLVLSNRISVVSDLYLQKNWPSVRYVIWNGVAWTVEKVEIQPPRIILSIGGAYHGKTKSRPGCDTKK